MLVLGIVLLLAAAAVIASVLSGGGGPAVVALLGIRVEMAAWQLFVFGLVSGLVVLAGLAATYSGGRAALQRRRELPAEEPVTPVVPVSEVDTLPGGSAAGQPRD